MGRGVRNIPKKLPEKLRVIRDRLGLSQSQLIKSLEIEGLRQSHISGYEVGKNEPPTTVLLKYAELANICVEIIINDKYDLPDKFPAKKLYHPH